MVAKSIRESIPTICEIKHQQRDVIIYTDAATSTRVVAACVVAPANFASKAVFSELRAEIPNPLWGETLRETTYIYGLGMLAVIAIFFALCGQLRNRNVTVYIDNSDARGSLAGEHTDTKAAGQMVQLFRAHAQRLGISVWFELIPSWVNPSDTPTRGAQLPLRVKQTKVFWQFGIP